MECFQVMSMDLHGFFYTKNQLISFLTTWKPISKITVTRVNLVVRCMKFVLYLLRFLHFDYSLLTVHLFICYFHPFAFDFVLLSVCCYFYNTHNCVLVKTINYFKLKNNIFFLLQIYKPIF